MRHRCVRCGKLTENYQCINGGPWHCFDGCYSTTGYDIRTIDGIPLWKGGKLFSDNRFATTTEIRK